MARFIALLRGINVGGRGRIGMADLRDLCGELGWRDVRTYIQSGNIVFDAAGKAPALEAALEKGLEARFGFAPAVIVRTAASWKAHADSNPFAEASAKEPNRVLMALAKRKLETGADRAIEAKAAAGERVRQAGEALWFHYPAGIGRSKLSPALIDRLAGSPVTARNWQTVQKLQEMSPP